MNMYASNRWDLIRALQDVWMRSISLSSVLLSAVLFIFHHSDLKELSFIVFQTLFQFNRRLPPNLAVSVAMSKKLISWFVAAACASCSVSAGCFSAAGLFL